MPTAALRHVCLVTLSLLSIFLFSGVVFGWAAFESILLSEQRFYSELCSTPCEEQQLALNRAFTLASTAVSIVALPAGWFVDTYGPVVGLALAGVLELVGLMGIAVCELIGSVHFDVFLFSLVTVAIAGSLCMFCGYAMPFLFPGRATLLMSATSCLFDASCIVFPAIKALYDSGVHFGALMWAYVAVALVVFPLLIGAWRLCGDELRALRATAPDEDIENGTRAGGGGLKAAPLGRQLLSIEFICICSYSAVQVTRSNLYLGTVGLVNDGVAAATQTPGADAEAALSTIGLIIPFGFVVIPLIDGCVQHVGLLVTLHVTSALGLAYNALQLAPSMLAQYAAAALFATFRAFLFSIVSSYNMATFGPRTMGRVMGLCFIAAALVNLAQVPLVNMTITALQGDCAPMLVAVLVASAPPSLVWLVVDCKQRSEAARVSSREEPLLPWSSLSLRASGTGAVLGPFSGPAVRKAELTVTV